MSLRAWFRRHRNVFSISTREVVAKGGEEDMLVEDYGARAVEARHPDGYGFRLRPTVYGVQSAGSVMPEVSEDVIAEGEPSPNSPS
jgi:hypothetical protein